MAERPILLCGPMVQKTISLLKTQTRRVVKLPKQAKWGTEYEGCIIFDNGSPFGHEMSVDEMVCPYGQIGDRLWVRETWSVPSIFDNQKPSDMDSDYFGVVRYLANGYRSGKLRPSIFMPRWASRILLEITAIRVERLHDISEQDAIAEGIECIKWPDGSIKHPSYTTKSPSGKRIESLDAKCSYLSLWESINGRESLESNPWVWVITFKVVEIKQ